VRRWGVLLVAVSAIAVAACGEEETRYDDGQIVDRLNLEQTDSGYAVDGDPFCEVDNKLLNDASEVEDAADRDDLGLVIASRQGNAGVKGVPPFAPDCSDEVKKKLNKLDPVPKEDEE
jgi:hypothetical protein